jgi:hypothetical protein
MGGEASSSQRPPLADSEHARGHHRARAAGVGLGCPSQSALLTLVAFARHDFPASGQADDVDERGHAASTTPTTSHVTANPIPVTTEMDMELARSTTRTHHPFGDSTQSLVPELRWEVGRRTLPGTSFLTRSGHVLFPDKLHPASARALKPRLPRSWLLWPRRSRPRSHFLPSDAAVWLSYAVSGGLVLSNWLNDQLLLVGTLAQWYVHHFPPLARNHLTIPGLYSTPPLNPSIRPYLSPTYEPLRPDLVAIWVAGDVAGSILYVLFELDTLSASLCCSADGQGAIFSVEVRDAWVGPVVGRSSERVLVSGIVYNG